MWLFVEISIEWPLCIVSKVHNYLMESKLECHILTWGRERVCCGYNKEYGGTKKHLDYFERQKERQCIGNKTCLQHTSKIQKSIRAERSEIKHLFKCLDDHNYDYKFRIVG